MPNIIVLVFDACSAENISLYGYPRNTMPNLDAFAEKAIVYHNHYSAGRFTTPGTASLLTGLYPWSHRALSLGASVLKQHADKNIFALLSEKYQTLGFTQNRYANVFLNQFRKHLDFQIPSNAFNDLHRDFYASILKNDAQIAFSSFDDNIVRNDVGYDASLFLGSIFRTLNLYNRKSHEATHRFGYPNGFPETDTYEYFSLENVVNSAISILQEIQSPTVTYLHLYPPHAPYRPTKKFKNIFRSINAWEPVEKPLHPRSIYKYGYYDLLGYRYSYDEFLASWDYEVARLFTFIRESGLHEDSYVIITSDHGEMFERGEAGHMTPLLYEPLIHIPLLVSCPGQSEREDVFAYTSSVDIVPTISYLTGLPIPDWAEGEPLPRLGGVEEDQRSIFTIDAANNSSFRQLTRASISLTKAPYRLTYYIYPDYQQFELYDLEADPEELNDLYPLNPAGALQMKNEMMQRMAEADRPFEGK
ncbi:MAG: sulfatase-like hydrolase/transferase [Anaerolineales bacterium]|nr:sulfatase-like hydrolase/transferase [Anaerolineales bacterium]